MKGTFISFEGTECAGKTTQIQLLTQLLDRSNLPYISVREPGSTRIGDDIRDILLSKIEYTEMDPRTEIFLYAASRAQLISQMIQPALMKNQIVICDRFVDSSIAYQGYGNLWSLEEVIQANQIATGGLKPNRTYLLDIPIEISRNRMNQRGNQVDRIEQKERNFHQRVRDGYFELAKREPERYKVIQADRSPEEIFTEIAEDIRSLLDPFIKHL